MNLPTMTTNGSAAANDFASTYAQVCREYREKHLAWVRWLQEQGVAAAHPDDGWVNRDANCVHFCYPHFIEAGDLEGRIVALGNHEKHRLVRITAHSSKGVLLPEAFYWFFEPLETKVNLPDAIERVRRMHSDAARCVKKFGGLMADGFPADVEALAVCLEALAEHAHDGGAILREVNPKAYAPIDTTKSAPPLTPEEQAHAASYKGPPLKCSCGKPSQCVAHEPG